jgi:predicted GH43/DUF377 family glycosyl hydrolase
MNRGVLWLALLLTGCGRYADFTLPPLPPAAAIHFEWAPSVPPVIPQGNAGAWDAHDALNPSVVVTGGTYYNFYSGFDGKTWHTGLATSADGVSWRKEGKVLSPDPATWEGEYIAANGSALHVGGEFLYWYHAGPREMPRIGLARSSDGHTWRKHPEAVIGIGPRGSWDERGVADPYVIQIKDTYYMYYLGQDRAHQQRIGVARSPDGIRWDKLRVNPVLELGETGAFDEDALGEPAVWMSHGAYWMLYTGRDRTGTRRLGLAHSSDGVAWKRQPPVFAGAASWDSKVLCDPAVEVTPQGIRVWFGGGDVASPDENLHGQIGLAILRPVDATLAK